MRRILSALLLLSGVLAAQTPFTVPPKMDKVEGGSDHWMVGRYTFGRAQQIYSSSILPGHPLVVKGFKMRRDGVRSTPYEAHKINFEVYMSNNSKDPASGYGMYFAANRGPDFRKVMNKKAVDWPALPIPSTPPAPFSILFPLDKPFAYKGKALLVEWVYTPYPTNPKKYYYWYADAESYSATFKGRPVKGTYVSLGKGCPSTFTNLAYLPYPGSRLQFTGYCQANMKKLLGVSLLGTSDKKWGAITLPFDLTPLGGPGCKLYINVVAGMTAFTDPSSPTGRIVFTWGCLPVDPTLSGQSFYEQEMVVDPSFNAIGLRVSRYRKYTIGTPFHGSVKALTFYAYTTNASTYHPDQCYAFWWSARADILQFLP